MNKISRPEFLERLSAITGATSTSEGVPYKSINCDGNRIRGIRCNGRNNMFSINVDKLYEAYLHLDKITTSTLKAFVPGVQSPSLAILSEMGLI